MSFFLNNSFDYKLLSFYEEQSKFFLTLKFPKSIVNITCGSGFPHRMNHKICVNKASNIVWKDERKEDLLKKNIENFIASPSSNLRYSIEISKLLISLSKK
jgi:hypothetical protein